MVQEVQGYAPTFPRTAAPRDAALTEAVFQYSVGQRNPGGKLRRVLRLPAARNVEDYDRVGLGMYIMTIRL
jgi:hypothetical protein